MKKLLCICIIGAMLCCGAALSEAEEPGTTISLPALTVTGEEVPEAPADAADEAEAPADAAEETEAPADTAEETEAPAERFALWFEEGFGLSLPEGWVSYPVSPADRTAGLRYALGDGDGHYLYIRVQSGRSADMAALKDMIDADQSLEKTGDLTFGDQPFIAFIDGAHNASGCATLWGDDIVTFLFTPQDDADYMLLATETMETFAAYRE